MRYAKELHFSIYCSHKISKVLIQNIWPVIYIIYLSLESIFPISIFICKDLMSICPGLNLVQSIFSCLSALAKPDVDLS